MTRHSEDLNDLAAAGGLSVDPVRLKPVTDPRVVESQPFAAN